MKCFLLCTNTSAWEVCLLFNLWMIKFTIIHLALSSFKNWKVISKHTSFKKYTNWDKLSCLSLYIFLSFWGSERRQKPNIPHLCYFNADSALLLLSVTLIFQYFRRHCSVPYIGQAEGLPKTTTFQGFASQQLASKGKFFGSEYTVGF